ncbi:flagellar biosynthesis protein FliR [Pontibacillus halophilus JSM 076056 = DSM 19796]|uniref:Flagellar biosynthetic protein FliR n=1 Tax=Pontibacillus halophilus JSM 076056 = DSM 19796 TaxID=1385510 RepID=A0A0A5GPI5_9BACI|nr:flagellar biosynthetic protein FliR [Pontibacillus halophilus]KGX93158.1 flagellar biosynthesis protein FliR [Pontibacillus halophilus JSM 076056 = DSM 19796]
MFSFIALNTLPAFLLIFVRVTAFFVTLPIFSYRNVPTPHKIGLSFFLAWIMFYTIDLPPIQLNGTFYMLVIKEALVGLCVGFIAYLVLAAIQVAGGFIDFQMGFAVANVIDPRTGAQSPLIGQYLNTITLLFLLVVDAHHLFIQGMFFSYEAIPLDQVVLPFSNESFAEMIMRTFTTMFAIAFQMAIPIVGCLFLVDVALGIIARTVPQLNVFVVGLPLKIFVSFVVLIVSFTFYTILAKKLFETMLEAMWTLMRLMGGA